jgi:hypothetical protein
MNYRIVRRDSLNWAIERWQGSGTISRGRYAGQQKKEGWDTINPVGYYPSLETAVTALTDKVTGDHWPEDGWTGEDLTTALRAVRDDMLAIVNAALTKQE